jgi:hypothetical protein
MSICPILGQIYVRTAIHVARRLDLCFLEDRPLTLVFLFYCGLSWLDGKMRASYNKWKDAFMASYKKKKILSYSFCVSLFSSINTNVSYVNLKNKKKGKSQVWASGALIPW